MSATHCGLTKHNKWRSLTKHCLTPHYNPIEYQQLEDRKASHITLLLKITLQHQQDIQVMYYVCSLNNKAVKMYTKLLTQKYSHISNTYTMSSHIQYNIPSDFSTVNNNTYKDNFCMSQ